MKMQRRQSLTFNRKMEFETLEIMALKAGIKITDKYCPFRDTDRCATNLGFCNTEHYEGCAGYNARVAEVVREWRQIIDEETQEAVLAS